MRIYDRDLASAAAAESGRAQDTQKVDREGTGSTGAAQSGASDRVELSSGLAGVSRALALNGSARAARVQELAAQFQSGTYQPNSLATSQGMVAEGLSGAR